MHAMQTRPAAPENHPTSQKTDQPRPTTNIPANDDDEKRKKKTKTQVRGRSLGEGADVDVRVEDGDRGQDEETQGETQTRKWVWVSPAPERERKRENVVGEQTKQTRKRGDTNIKANKGQVLKGTKPNNISTPKTKKTTQKTKQIPRKHLTKRTNTKHTESQGNYHSRVAGPMGRPALSEETPQGTVVPRGPKTPPPREPPPVAQKQASCRTIS